MVFCVQIMHMAWFSLEWTAPYSSSDRVVEQRPDTAPSVVDNVEGTTQTCNSCMKVYVTIATPLAHYTCSWPALDPLPRLTDQISKQFECFTPACL